MEKFCKSTEEYMLVGELAKKVGVSANTLRYYDKEGLLAPSHESESGYRLYTDRDMVKLVQILTMKQLGFSLSDVKKSLVAIDTPEDMVRTLAEHAASVSKKIENLSDSLKQIETLKEEVEQLKVVDFKKYTAILKSLQMKNENYWAIKYFDDDMLDHVYEHFGNDEARARVVIETMKRLIDDAVQYKEDGVLPESPQAQNLAKEFWHMVEDFTGGDISLISNLIKFTDSIYSQSGEQGQNIRLSNDFISAALDIYFAKLGYDPTTEQNGGNQ